MVGLRSRGEIIRKFIIDNVASNPTSIVAITADEFGVSRQAVNSHIKRLIDQKSIVAEGNTRKRIYKLHPEVSISKEFSLDGLEEDLVWRNFIRPNIGVLPDNIIDIWSYGFTEMLNNAIDHSQGESVHIRIEKNPAFSQVIIIDNGEGIFRRIQRLMGLHDERHAVLELAKGKLTTDPENHTGEGIFFSSRMFDEYAILSGGVYFFHEFSKPEDWIIEHQTPQDGTTIFMQIANNSSRTIKSVFDKFASGSEYGFDKTIVPVSLARYGNEMLVSRSQAKRLLAGVDRFKIVTFDFSGIEKIGQAFADEVFRVFKNQHPDMQVYFSQANKDVENMIIRTLSSDKT